MGNITIMYHYVRDDPNFKAFTTKQFREQVEYLVKRYRVITLSEYLDNKPVGDTCILTFDDGLKDGYANCLPVLEEFGIKAVFLIPTSILAGGRMLSVQRRTLVLNKIGIRALVDEYNQLVPDYLQINEGKSFDGYNDPLVSNLKYTLDYMDYDTAENLIDTIFRIYFVEAVEFEKMYLSVGEMLELRKRGMDIGTHGHNHRWLGNLYLKDQYEDLRHSVDTFKSIFKTTPRFMSYPFGSQNFMTHKLLAHFGFEAGLLDPTSAVGSQSQFGMNRCDCIDVTVDGIPDLFKRVVE